LELKATPNMQRKNVHPKSTNLKIPIKIEQQLEHLGEENPTNLQIYLEVQYNLG
jgi:hypothetical protein